MIAETEVTSLMGSQDLMMIAAIFSSKSQSSLMKKVNQLKKRRKNLPRAKRKALLDMKKSQKSSQNLVSFFKKMINF